MQCLGSLREREWEWEGSSKAKERWVEERVSDVWWCWCWCCHRAGGGGMRVRLCACARVRVRVESLLSNMGKRQRTRRRGSYQWTWITAKVIQAPLALSRFLFSLAQTLFNQLIQWAWRPLPPAEARAWVLTLVSGRLAPSAVTQLKQAGNLRSLTAIKLHPQITLAHHLIQSGFIIPWKKV